MSLNIQTQNGLVEIGKVTKEKVTTALGYTPADETTLANHVANIDIHITAQERTAWNNKSDFSGDYTDLENVPNITENESEDLIIADNNGNIIAKFDSDGLDTTNIDANSVNSISLGAVNINANTIILDGEDLGAKIETLEAESLPNIIDDESNKFIISDTEGNIIAQIDENGLETTSVTADEVIVDDIKVGETLKEHIQQVNDNKNTLAAHIGNEVIHITADERTFWNNKSEFSGDYNDLENAPNITEDNSGDLIIADNDGNIALRVNDEGLQVKALTVNGNDFETTIAALAGNITNIENGTTQVGKAINDSEGNKIIDTYETKSDAESKLTEAKEYADKLIEDLPEYALNNDLAAHIGDKVVHITDEERQEWNNKSEFSGNYADLIDAPNIFPEEEDKGIIIIDGTEDQNVIAKIDSDGLKTTKVEASAVVIDGTDVKTTFAAVQSDIAGIKNGDIIVNKALNDSVGNKIVDTYETKADASSKLTELKEYTDQKVADIVDSAPDTLNTLKELSQALGNDENFATTVTAEIGKKADKTDFENHINNKENPHEVTKAQLGLDKVENKSSTDILSELVIDTALSNTSTNLIQNKPIATAIGNVTNDLAAHVGDKVVHITADERTSWNNKSEFSGNYSDLADAPMITPEEEDDRIVIVDGTEDQNVLAQIDSDGLKIKTIEAEDINVGGQNILNTFAQINANIDKKANITDVELKLDKTDFNTFKTENTNAIEAAQQAAIDAAATDAASQVSAAKTELSNDLATHVGNKNNPHEVTKAQVGLGNVDNTSDIDKPVSTAQQAALDELNTNITADIATKMDKENPTGTGRFSLNRMPMTTVGNYSVAIGYQATASGYVSYAEGYSTTSSGNGSHAEGVSTVSSGYASHAEGSDTASSGYASHAEGYGTIASGSSSHVQGSYNIEDTDNVYAHIVGNGDTNSRSNAHTIDWNGNAWFAGDIYVGGTSQDDEAAVKLSSIGDAYLPLSGGTLTGPLAFTEDVGYGTALPENPVEGQIFFLDEEDGEVGIKTASSTEKSYVLGVPASDTSSKTINYNTNVYTSGSVLYGAAWNDYAEYRICNEDFKAGQVVCENNDDTLSIASYRLQPGANIISDTFGFVIGETKEAKCPIAVSGRVLAYTYEPREEFQAGDAVCAGPNGTVSRMTREEIREYPERIIGTVSAVPSYKTWGEKNVIVDNRIWIKVR